MKLYHYTALPYLFPILLEGITKGDVFQDLGNILNGVNLTNDPSAQGHGICSGTFVSPDIAWKQGLMKPGRPVPYFPDKRKVRITVDVERSTVTRWLRWANKNVVAKYRNGLIRTGGGMAKARSWYFRFEPIHPDQFERVEIRQNDQWVDFRDYPDPWEEEYTDQALVVGFKHWGTMLCVGRSKSFLAQLDQALLDSMQCAA